VIDRRLFLALASAGALVLFACTKQPMPPEFTAPMTLGGRTVQPEVLNAGRLAFTDYCYACHGHRGDGRGPSSFGYRPPPRDFRTGTFKFAGSVAGLPHDEDLIRIVKGGLHGTAMLNWDVPDDELSEILQYIKTFVPAGESWKDPDEALGERIVPPPDPFAGKKEEAIAQGKRVYHAAATCWSCHPAYAIKKEIYDASVELGKPITDFRKDLYFPEAKQADYAVEGKKMKILPPDFAFMPVRSVRNAADLFRLIGAGIPGTAMPQWSGSLADDKIWAMAYYVESLIAMRNTPAADELRKELMSQPEFVPPAPEAKGDEEKAEGKADEKKAEGKADEKKAEAKADEKKAEAKADEKKAEAKAGEKKAEGKATPSPAEAGKVSTP